MTYQHDCMTFYPHTLDFRTPKCYNEKNDRRNEMGHLSYLRRLPGNTLKQGTPFQLADSPRYFADHVNCYGSKFAPLYVVSAGFDCNWPERNLDRTLHRLVLYYVVGGKCFFNGEPVQSGEMFFALPNIHHSIVQDSEEPSKAWWVTVGGTNLTAFLEYCNFQSKPGVRSCEKAEEIISYIRDMVYEPHFGVSPEAILSADLLHIIAIQRYDNSTYLSYPAIGNSHVREALKYIEDHCLQRLTVEDIAQHIHVSPKYLSNIFSKYAGCSIRDFLIQAKMKVAQSLLKSNRLSVRDISEILGYSDYYQFSRQYKKHYGISPSEFRSRENQKFPD